jgi:hypothetical protein
MAVRFTPDNPPKSGAALKLWRWWEQMNGQPPRYLDVCRPGYWQSARGAAHYIITGDYYRTYLIYSPPDALKQTMQDAQIDRMTGDYHFN